MADLKENALYRELSPEQAVIAINAQQLFQAWAEAYRRAHSMRGGMHWKTVKGKQYLFRTRDRHGYGKSLGPRTRETEQTLEQFKRGKVEVRAREAGLRRRLSEQARFCKAAKIARVPRITAALARELWRAGLEDALLIVGTNALYAYEIACGVQFTSAARLETEDLDLLFDSRRSLELLSADARRSGLIGILKKIDHSFIPMDRGGFRAVNDRGFMVDLIRPMPKPPWKKQPDRVGRRTDLKAADIENLDWYLSAPRFRQIVIGDDGFPAPMTVPDPRVFALHKLWLSRQATREAIKRPKDQEQARLVAQLVARYLPQFPFSKEELRMLPSEVADLIDQLPVDGTDAGKLPPGFEPPEA